MTRPDTPLDDDARDRAVERTFGALDPEDARRFDAEAAQRPALRAECDALRRTADALAAATPEAEPAPEVRARLMARITGTPPAQATAPAQPWKSWTETAHRTANGVVRSDDTGFEPTAYPGIEVRRLFVDRAAGRTTMMVRMAPGTSYPAHRHGGFEECFVLEGTLHVGESVLMRRGDYQAQTEDSVHPVQWTDDGCVLLISSSLSDEFV
jgi:quercetin dioxygenase-like cupin family protein